MNGKYDKYLKLNKNFQAIHYIRDPRAVLSSFKITFAKNYGYFNCVFQWIDSVNYHKYLVKRFKKKILIFKFEDIHQFPKRM